MPLFPRLLTLLLLTAGTANVPAATTSSSKSKSKGKTSTSSTSSSTSKSKAPEKSETADKPKTETSEKSSSTSKSEATAKKSETAVVTEDTPKQEPRPAAVSTMSIEEISGFTKYPKQVQSLVQSALALTHLELRYMYGSHEPNKGGMDCSGTIYHVLHFQGLKDVPRQSDEMAMWVEKKSQLHLTPTATDFDSPEFADLKPGDLLFWTNTTTTTRKLPVTHVMIYLGKRKEDGKRIIFGASDGRSFSGLRRSGVSVFDFNLPRAEGTARLHGYGPAPGLLPAEMTLASAAPKPATPSVTATPAVTAPVKEEPKKKPAMVVATAPETKAKVEPKEETPKVAATPPYVKVKKTPEPAVPAKSDSPPPEAKAKEEPKPVEEPPALASTDITKTSPTPAPAATEPKIEVRKAVSVVTDNDGTAEAAEETPTPVVAAKSAVSESSSSTKTEPKKVASSKPKTTTTKPRSSTTTKKKSVQVSSRRRAPAPPPKSQVEQAFDRAINSVKRVFR